MASIEKAIAKDSCNWALSTGNASNETNIKVTKEIAEMFGKLPEDGDGGYKIQYKLYKEDFIRSLCSIIAMLPLADSRTGKSKNYSKELFDEDFKAIQDFFGDNETQIMEATLAKPKKHSLCLNFGSKNFPIREYLVEKYSVLKFIKKGDEISIRVFFSRTPEDIDSDDGGNVSYDDTFQQIYYGAPGTGKSHGVKEETDAWEKAGRVVRTTFHPDSDYSTFVGAYKPTMEYLPVRNSSGLFVRMNGSTTTDASERDVIREKQITYSFVPQAFLHAYVAAWSDQSRPEYLVIEEINRGNCAQIFGDLFQLLDRADTGYSEYPVKSDKDLEAYLKDAFERNGVVISNYPKVQSGEELRLPSNLLIRATMNTSDQSLFPIDSAFKRRWDWQYVPIHDAGEGYQIEVAGKKYGWWSFVKEINERILRTTSSEDKQLGYFFCKAKDGKVISAETFVSKVVFYLWNDVFKDYEFGDDAFNDDPVDGKPHKLEFRDFYEAGEKGKPVVVTEKIEKFFSNLGLTPLKSGSGNAAEEAVLEDDTSEFIEADFEDEKKKDTSKYSVNGVGAFQKTYLAYEVMKLFVKNNPEMSADEIVSSWEPFTGISKNIVVSEDNYNSYIDASNDPPASKRYIDVVTANDEMVYVSTQWNLDRLNAFSDKLNELNWPYTITKVEE